MSADRRWNGKLWVYDAIDHINGDPTDNRLENVRVVEVACNPQAAPPNVLGGYRTVASWPRQPEVLPLNWKKQ